MELSLIPPAKPLLAVLRLDLKSPGKTAQDEKTVDFILYFPSGYSENFPLLELTDLINPITTMAGLGHVKRVYETDDTKPTIWALFKTEASIVPNQDEMDLLINAVVVDLGVMVSRRSGRFTGPVPFEDIDHATLLAKAIQYFD